MKILHPTVENYDGHDSYMTCLREKIAEIQEAHIEEAELAAQNDENNDMENDEEYEVEDAEFGAELEDHGGSSLLLLLQAAAQIAD